MPYSAAAVKRYLCLALSLGLMVGFIFATPTAQAASTQVDALVCGGANGATITIDQPASDSVVNHPAVTVKGDVTNSTQIDVSVDGNYNSTVPLDAHQTTYEFDVNLSQGTHTIKLVANDVCQTQDATASVVVTFQPQTQPGDGGSTPTTSGGVTIGGPPQTGVEPVESGLNLSQVPVIGAVFNFFGWVGHTLDFDTAGQQGLGMAILRFAMIIGGLLLLVFGSALFEFIMLIPWFKHHRVQRIRNMSHWRGGWHGWALHLLGLILFLAAFVI